jgi:tRNA (guanine-N7-)-methyltransferase
VGKDKLVRWTELLTFDKVIQPEIGDVTGKDHPVKGNWNNKIFNNPNPIILELGCGKGEYTVELARKFPDNNYIGVDIKGARIWRGAKTANEEGLPNVAFLRTRIEFIPSFFSADEVSEIWITFPDPHPGGKNFNKRLTSPVFLNKYRLFLKNNGEIHLKTDNTELFIYTLKMLDYNNIIPDFMTTDLYSENFRDDISSIKTHYEKIYLKEGKKINYLSFLVNKEKTFENVSCKKI